MAQTKAHLHDKTFLADIAKEFGQVLGRPNGLRNADNAITMSQAGTEVHAIRRYLPAPSMTSWLTCLAYERNPARVDDAAVLHRVGDYLRGPVLRSPRTDPSSNAACICLCEMCLTLICGNSRIALKYSALL